MSNENEIMKDTEETSAENNLPETENETAGIEETDNSEIERNSDAVSEETAQEANLDQAEIEKNNDEKEFIEEFAPAPISIPNYNKEKEQKKREKVKAKHKKRNAKKSKKRRRLIRKIVKAVRTTVLFVLLLAVAAVTLFSLLIRVNTTEFSVKSAIVEHEPERFVVGDIKYPSKIDLEESSSRASIADIIRDNVMDSVTITYNDIEQIVRKSSYVDFVADTAYDVIGYYVYGKDFKELSAADISNVILSNADNIRLVTGRVIGETASDDYAEYISSSAAFKELKKDALAKQPLAEYTYITSVLFSPPVLIVAVIILMALLVLIVVACNGFAHKVIGWGIMISGALVGAIGCLYKPMFNASSEFVKCVVEALANSFNKNSLVFGAVVFAVGLLVMLIGHAMSDEAEEEEYDEEDYIEEIEQVSTAQ